MGLDIRERKYLMPAIVYGWKIIISSWRNEAFWNGDLDQRVRVGAIAERLIEKGYLEVIHNDPASYANCQLIATAKALSWKCTNKHCLHGIIVDSNGKSTDSKCPVCNAGIRKRGGL